jgi:hypothetical protein
MVSSGTGGAPWLRLIVVAMTSAVLIGGAVSQDAVGELASGTMGAALEGDLGAVDPYELADRILADGTTDEDS